MRARLLVRTSTTTTRSTVQVPDGVELVVGEEVKRLSDPLPRHLPPRPALSSTHRTPCISYPRDPSVLDHRHLVAAYPMGCDGKLVPHARASGTRRRLRTCQRVQTRRVATPPHPGSGNVR
eukprot:637168-Rhodomonas_salina.1